MIFGITNSDQIYTYLAPAGSQVARSILESEHAQPQKKLGIFYSLPLSKVVDSLSVLLDKLGLIHRSGWHLSRRLDKFGNVMDYRAQNGGGYTLEALMGITPNGRSEPDFMGWELKAVSGNRITLMTPEPDGGYYGEQGVEAFVRKYGHETPGDTLYFTGIHKVGITNESTKITMKLDGFDSKSGKITDLSGGIILSSEKDEIAAVWSFERLLSHWGRKHAQAAYIKLEKQEQPEGLAYKYLSPVWLGEGTDFSLFLKVMSEGIVVYDPAPKVSDASSTKSRVKARNQFRIGFGQLSRLYKTFSSHEI